MLQFSSLPETEVVSLTAEEEGKGLVVTLRSTAEPPIVCPYCGGTRTRNGTRRMIFRDISQHGQPIKIEWTRQKFRCPRCNYASHDNHPAFYECHAVTRRFIEWVSSEGRKVTFVSLSKLSGVHEKVIREIFAKTQNFFHSVRSDMLGIELIKVAGSLYPALIDIHNKEITDVFATLDALELDIAMRDLSMRFAPDVVVREIELPDDFQAYLSSCAGLIISRSSLQRVAVAAIEVKVAELSKHAQESSAD